MKDYFKIGDFFKYFVRKPSFSEKNKSLAAMHFINKFAIIVGLIGVAIVIYKNLF